MASNHEGHGWHQDLEQTTQGGERGLKSTESWENRVGNGSEGLKCSELRGSTYFFPLYPKISYLTDQCQALEPRPGLGGMKVLVIFLPDCHESIAGIVAGRMREFCNKPVFIVTKAEQGLKGSGRSVEAYHMYDAMTEIKDGIFQLNIWKAKNHIIRLML